MLQVTTEAIMNALPTVKQDEICYVTSESKYFKYNNDSWEPITIQGNIDLNIYDMNKSIVSQLPVAKAKELTEGKKKIKGLAAQGKYFMLLCNELRYYTIFKIEEQSETRFAQAVIDCANDIGIIKSINYPDDNKQAIEIWIEDNEGPHVMYLFNYDKGVVQCAV